MEERFVSSGHAPLDDVIQGLRLGDNVVWQVDELGDYVHFARRFAERALRDGAPCVYVRFAPHPPVLAPAPGITVVEVDPGRGFDAFSGAILRLAGEAGRGVRHVFDNLSALAAPWTTDEQIANFFQFACPYLFELDTVAYFALTRRKHDSRAIARIRDTTQVLFDLFRAGGHLYVHPLKAAGRYAPQMFLPHRLAGEELAPAFPSGSGPGPAANPARPALTAPERSIAPWESVYRRLLEYRGNEDAPEVAPLKQEFRRMLLGDHRRINELADHYLTLEDLFRIRERMIGSGQIGGKAAGMLLARRILRAEWGEEGDPAFGEEDDSFFIGSDVFYSFLVQNGLFRLRWQLAREPEPSDESFREVERRFLAGEFPPEIVEQFRAMLEHFGRAPVIVRSSSFLEDGFGNAFAGKYRSEFCANQGDAGARLEEFLRAVKLVYASTLNPDALSYRRKRNLIDRDEQMAILVQRVAGSHYKHYFFPSVAGVAHSRNLFAWNERIDERQGLVRMVFGLGTRAVNRVGGDYPRLVALSHPALRPEYGRQILKYSQRRADVLDLRENRFATVAVADLLAEEDYPHLNLYASRWSDDYAEDPWPAWTPAGGAPVVLTFNNLLERTNFVPLLREMLATLERAYGHPVDTEFTASVGEGRTVRINLVQCRPLALPDPGETARIAHDIPPGRVLFRSTAAVRGGSVAPIRYILYVDPAAYQAAPVAVKRSLPHLVGRINRFAGTAAERSGERVMLMGPGRWGSSNIDLGIGVGYAHINQAHVLVEMAREAAGLRPELSFGTHFFQDLVEDEIVYLAVYPDDPAAAFNAPFFAEASDVLAEVFPDAAGFAGVVRLIDVRRATGGYARVLADPQARLGICYLDEARPADSESVAARQP